MNAESNAPKQLVKKPPELDANVTKKFQPELPPTTRPESKEQKTTRSFSARQTRS